jgi:hypothetical protein
MIIRKLVSIKSVYLHVCIRISDSYRTVQTHIRIPLFMCHVLTVFMWIYVRVCVCVRARASRRVCVSTDQGISDIHWSSVTTFITSLIFRRRPDLSELVWPFPCLAMHRTLRENCFLETQSRYTVLELLELFHCLILLNASRIIGFGGLLEQNEHINSYDFIQAPSDPVTASIWRETFDTQPVACFRMSGAVVLTSVEMSKAIWTSASVGPR